MLSADNIGGSMTLSRAHGTGSPGLFSRKKPFPAKKSLFFYVVLSLLASIGRPPPGLQDSVPRAQFRRLLPSLSPLCLLSCCYSSPLDLPLSWSNNDLMISCTQKSFPACSWQIDNHPCTSQQILDLSSLQLAPRRTLNMVVQ